MSAKKIIFLALIFLLTPAAVAQAETVSSSVAGFNFSAGSTSDNPVISTVTLNASPTAAVGATFISGAILPTSRSLYPTPAGSAATVSVRSATIPASVGYGTATIVVGSHASASAATVAAPNPQPAETVFTPAPTLLPAPASLEARTEVTKPSLPPTLTVPTALVVEPSTAEQAEIANWFEDKKSVEQTVIKKSVITKKVVKKKTVTVKKKLIVKVKKNIVPAR